MPRAYLSRWLFEAKVMPAGPKNVDYGGRTSALVKNGNNGAEYFCVLHPHMTGKISVKSGEA